MLLALLVPAGLHVGAYAYIAPQYAPPMRPVGTAGISRRAAGWRKTMDGGFARICARPRGVALKVSGSSSPGQAKGGADREVMEKAAAKVQAWLEDVYESVDYEASLIRAGVIDPSNILSQEGADASDGEIAEVLSLEDLAFMPDSSYLPMEQDMTIDHLGTGSSSGDICEGKEGELTYGEMDLAFFLSILKYVGPPNGRKFVDVGCGRGQLVLAAALVGGWGRCEGIEIMNDVLEIGNGALDVVRGPSCPPCPRLGKGGSDGFEHVKLHQGDMYVDTETLRDADVIMAYATCFATEDGEVLGKLSKVFASSTKPDATVITVNKRLKEEDGFDLVDTLQVLRGLST
jgi:hypothetical protein